MHLTWPLHLEAPINPLIQAALPPSRKYDRTVWTVPTWVLLVLVYSYHILRSPFGVPIRVLFSSPACQPGRRRASKLTSSRPPSSSARTRCLASASRVGGADQRRTQARCMDGSVSNQCVYIYIHICVHMYI